MIKTIHVQGLKSLLNIQVNFAPLTVLSGINSSGKSTLIQAIRMLERFRREKKVFLDHYGEFEELLFKKQTPTKGITVPKEISIEVKDAWGKWNCKMHAQKVGGNTPPHWTQKGTAVGEHTYCYNFLSAARFGPQSYLPLHSDRGMFHVGEQGEFVCECLSNYEDLKLPESLQHVNAEGHTLAYNTSAWLSDIVSNARVSLLKEKLFDLANTTYNGFRPHNVGFGLSYTLPVIVALLGMSGFIFQHNCPGLCIIENPEAHIHPQGQTKLGRLIALAARAGLQVIVETHSDYIMDGVRLAVKNGDIIPEDVNFLFFQLNNDGYSEVEVIKADLEGRLSAWPQGFFDQGRRNKALLAGFTS